VTRSQLIKNYENNPDLTWQENKKARDAYYAEVRAQVLEEVRASLEVPVAIPGIHDPEGLTTLDLDNLTSAGETDANETGDS
jgi:hypothetical protein